MCLQVISLTRPLDSWLEHVDFRTLFRCLTNEEVLKVFASTVLERRIIFMAEELRYNPNPYPNPNPKKDITEPGLSGTWAGLLSAC